MDKKLTEHFTLVFRGDIRKFETNPYHVESQWGKPIAIAMGDALTELDISRVPDDDARAYMAGVLRVIVAIAKRDGLTEIYGYAQAALDLAELGPEGCAKMRGDAVTETPLKSQ